MNLQICLINLTTGEPIYDQVLTRDDVLKPSGDSLLYDHMDAARTALQNYKPRMLPPLEQSSDPASAEGAGDVDLFGGTDMGMG